jgi:hypothetical protein
MKRWIMMAPDGDERGQLTAPKVGSVIVRFLIYLLAQLPW